MPELEYVGVIVKRGDGANFGVVEVFAVRALPQAIDLLIGKVDVECLVNESCALGVGKLGQLDDVVDGERGDFLRDVKTATLSEAVNDGFGEGNGLGAAAARVGVEVVSESGVAVQRISHEVALLFGE